MPDHTHDERGKHADHDNPQVPRTVMLGLPFEISPAASQQLHEVTPAPTAAFRISGTAAARRRSPPAAPRAPCTASTAASGARCRRPPPPTGERPPAPPR